MYMKDYYLRGATRSRTLDEELPNKDIYLLKVDVEGFEEEVLTKGGRYIFII